MGEERGREQVIVRRIRKECLVMERRVGECPRCPEPHHPTRRPCRRGEGIHRIHRAEVYRAILCPDGTVSLRYPLLHGSDQLKFSGHFVGWRGLRLFRLMLYPILATME